MENWIGQIILVGFNYAPINTVFCQGQIFSISQYNALFALLGTTFGGDGVQTFGLPDLRARVPIGTGQSPVSGVSVQFGQVGQSLNAPAQVGTGVQVPFPTLGLNYLICVNGIWPTRSD